jgi:hypothetical protein
MLWNKFAVPIPYYSFPLRNQWAFPRALQNKPLRPASPRLAQPITSQNAQPREAVFPKDLHSGLSTDVVVVARCRCCRSSALLGASSPSHSGPLTQVRFSLLSHRSPALSPIPVPITPASLRVGLLRSVCAGVDQT